MPAQITAGAVGFVFHLFDVAGLKINHFFGRPFQIDNRIERNERGFVRQSRRLIRRGSVRVRLRIRVGARRFFALQLLIVSLRRQQQLITQRNGGLRRIIADGVVNPDLLVEGDRDFCRIRRPNRLNEGQRVIEAAFASVFFH